VAGCPDENELLSLLVLEDGAARDRLEAHLDTCESCRLTALVLAETLPGHGLDEPPPRFRSAAPSSADEVFEGRFRLNRVLGEGGFSVVWEASDEITGERVAVKILSDDDAASARRAIREARGLAAMDHPHLLKAREAFRTVDGRTAIVTELLEGQDLAAAIETAPLSETETRRVLLAIAEGLGYAHARGVIHRDLKPKNVFLQGPGRFVRVLDFGLARWLDTLGITSRLTRTGTLLGTPAYMSPEQIAGEPDVGPETDLWSLGVLAVECLSGAPPIEGKTFGRIFRVVTEGTFPRLAERAPHASPALVTLVDALLVARREARPTAAEVVRRLSESG
jgi:eukaryotic-like serine/threonine-protein kinase